MSETQASTVDPSAALSKLLQNPDLIRNLSAILGASSGAAPAGESSAGSPSSEGEGAVSDGISRVLSNPEMMAKLPEVMKMLAPMMQPTAQSPSATVPASATQKPVGEGRDHRDCRNDLLVALKPFLSPARCQAVDMLLGLSRLGYALEKLI